MTIYLIGEPSYELAKSIASKDSEARMILLEDAVYLATMENNERLYVVSDDVERRGLKSKLQPGTNLINYDRLVEMMEKERVVNIL